MKIIHGARCPRCGGALYLDRDESLETFAGCLACGACYYPPRPAPVVEDSLKIRYEEIQAQKKAGREALDREIACLSARGLGVDYLSKRFRTTKNSIRKAISRGNRIQAGMAAVPLYKRKERDAEPWQPERPY